MAAAAKHLRDKDHLVESVQVEQSCGVDDVEGQDVSRRASDRSGHEDGFGVCNRARDREHEVGAVENIGAGWFGRGLEFSGV